MKMSKVVDPKLIGMGLGVFAATFLSSQIVDKLDDQTGFVGDYAREIAGAVLTVGGSLLMGNKKTKTIGLAMGATGVSTVASGLVRRFTGKTASTPPSSNGGIVNIPGGSVGGGLVLASVPVANGRGAFTLA